MASFPPTSGALRNFLALSPCPFAQRARIRGGGPWPDPQPLSDRLDDLHDDLCRIHAGEDLDLLALELEQAAQLTTPLQAASLLHACLDGLRRRDRCNSDPLTKGIESPGWDFEHGDEGFFVSLFAPFYPASHSRFSGNDGVAFVLFQPERSFRRFGVSSRRPGREKLSEAVQRRFQRRGQDYDAALNARMPKALRFVKPLRPDDPPIAWWQVPYEAEAG